MKRRHLSAVVLCTCVGIAGFAREAKADGYIDRSVAAGSLQFRGAAGLGFGQYRDPVSGDSKFGYGSSLEVAGGIPIIGELGVRVAYRFSDEGALAGADRFARPFDTVTYTTGPDKFSNPELSWTMAWNLKVVDLGPQLRVVPGIANGSDWLVTLGVPVRIRIPSVLRIDTGVFGSYVKTTSDPGWVMHVPAQVYFKAGPLYAGIISGVTYVKNDAAKMDEASFIGGLGAVYSMGPLDVKLQVYSTRINDSHWSKLIGGGLGAELRLP